jgi:hypothetical protein
MYSALLQLYTVRELQHYLYPLYRAVSEWVLKKKTNRDYKGTRGAVKFFRRKFNRKYLEISNVPLYKLTPLTNEEAQEATTEKVTLSFQIKGKTLRKNSIYATKQWIADQELLRVDNLRMSPGYDAETSSGSGIDSESEEETSDQENPEESQNLIHLQQVIEDVALNRPPHYSPAVSQISSMEINPRSIEMSELAALVVNPGAINVPLTPGLAQFLGMDTIQLVTSEVSLDQPSTSQLTPVRCTSALQNCDSGLGIERSELSPQVTQPPTDFGELQDEEDQDGRESLATMDRDDLSVGSNSFTVYAEGIDFNKAQKSFVFNLLSGEALDNDRFPVSISYSDSVDEKHVEVQLPAINKKFPLATMFPAGQRSFIVSEAALVAQESAIDDANERSESLENELRVVESNLAKFKISYDVHASTVQALESMSVELESTKTQLRLTTSVSSLSTSSLDQAATLEKLKQEHSEYLAAQNLLYQRNMFALRQQIATLNGTVASKNAVIRNMSIAMRTKDQLIGEQACDLITWKPNYKVPDI